MRGIDWELVSRILILDVLRLMLRYVMYEVFCLGCGVVCVVGVVCCCDCVVC